MYSHLSPSPSMEEYACKHGCVAVGLRCTNAIYDGAFMTPSLCKGSLVKRLN